MKVNTITVNRKAFETLLKSSKQALLELELENVDHSCLTYGHELTIKPTMQVIKSLKAAIQKIQP
jgi:uncharacterized protein YaaR (DUF327 family)